MKALDWLARTAMLVLAALATLALIGSLASVSNSSLGDAFPGEVAPPAETVAEAEPPADPRVVEPGRGTMTIETPAAAPAPLPAEREVARWLKALTYAVLALAAVAAAGVVALVRVGSRLA